MARHLASLLLVPGLLVGCLMSRVEFLEGGAGAGGSGANSGAGTDSGQSGKTGGGAAASEGGAPTGDAGDGGATAGSQQGGKGGATAGAGGTGGPPGCGDGLINLDDQCDDRNQDSADGCSSTCQLEPGFFCDAVGFPCQPVPTCPAGKCPDRCGDGHVTGSEKCDDGNAANADGCSANCIVEGGFSCVDSEAPSQITLPVTYRDFIRAPIDMKHPDQETYFGTTPTLGLVAPQLSGGLPAYTGLCDPTSPNVNDSAKCPNGAQTSSKAAFDQWYRDVPGVNQTFHDVMILTKKATSYEFDGGNPFAPLSNRGFVADGDETALNATNFGFTTELRFWSVLRGDETLTFTGDDDVWVFVANRLVIDMGGMHLKTQRVVKLDAPTLAALGIALGGLYEVSVFHAERGPTDSNFRLALEGFSPAASACTPN